MLPGTRGENMTFYTLKDELYCRIALSQAPLRGWTELRLEMVSWVELCWQYYGLLFAKKETCNWSLTKLTRRFKMKVVNNVPRYALQNWLVLLNGFTVISSTKEKNWQSSCTQLPALALDIAGEEWTSTLFRSKWTPFYSMSILPVFTPCPYTGHAHLYWSWSWAPWL